MKIFWSSGLEKISDSLSIKLPLQIGKQSATTSRHANIHNDSTIVFVLSLSGRYKTFQRFLRNYETVCLSKPNTNTELLLVLFRDDNIDLMPYYNELDKLRLKYATRINHITLNGNFSRGIALNEAAHSPYIQMNHIIFFIDVDIVFNQQSLDRIRMNTIRQNQVYLPIVFSEYNPNRSNITITEFGEEAGYFRQFGFGICAIYKSDVLHPEVNGFNTDITGWGLEDVRFLERIVKLNKKPIVVMTNTADAATGAEQVDEQNALSLTLSVFRAPDPSLIHVYHEIHCDKMLNEAQYVMCLGTKANTLGSYKYIESLFVNNRTLIEYASANNKIS